MTAMTAVQSPGATARSWPLTITVAGLPPSPNRRMAWQARRRLVKPLVDAVVLQCRTLGLEQPLARARVQFTLIHTRGRLRDADNAQSSCKLLLDALVLGGLLVDDGPDHVALVAIVQVYGVLPCVTIEVWPAQAPRAGEAGLDQ
jgi:Holliday junction resolvase RusA-like endonuclease